MLDKTTDLSLYIFDISEYVPEYCSFIKMAEMGVITVLFTTFVILKLSIILYFCKYSVFL